VPRSHRRWPGQVGRSVLLEGQTSSDPSLTGRHLPRNPLHRAGGNVETQKAPAGVTLRLGLGLEPLRWQLRSSGDEKGSGGDINAFLRSGHLDRAGNHGERARAEPRYGGLRHVVGSGDIGLRLALSESLDSLSLLMRRHHRWATEAHALGLLVEGDPG
jgi:hypothetical protein